MRREHALIAVLKRHLEKGGTIIEAQRTHWQLGQNIFIDRLKNDAGHIATHVARRVIGFGWTVQLTPLIAPLDWTRIEAGKEVA